MPSVTFFALLNEAHIFDNFQTRKKILVSVYPSMEKDNQEEVQASLRLPEEVLSDILDSETTDDINILKEALNGD